MKKEVNASPKKKWAKPKLIILTRGKPEEGVLITCKDFDPAGGTGGFTGSGSNCRTFICSDCNTYTST